MLSTSTNLYHSISNNVALYSFRLERLDENFEAIKADIEERLRLEALKRM